MRVLAAAAVTGIPATISGTTAATTAIHALDASELNSVFRY